MGGGWEGGGGGGGGTYKADHRGTAASNRDYNSLRYKCCTGLVLLPGAEFQADGKAKLGSFFTNSTRWGGNIKVVSIAKYSLWISFSVGYPHSFATSSKSSPRLYVHILKSRSAVYTTVTEIKRSVMYVKIGEFQKMVSQKVRNKEI